MSDDIRRWSDELARDPSSMVFLQLGEALRRQGQSDLALKVALRGLERRPHNADAHDLLARIYVDRGELERAFDEWDMVLRLIPEHAGALKGMGFVYFRQEQLDMAERFLTAAAHVDDGDPSIQAAIDVVRARRQGGGATEDGAGAGRSGARANGAAGGLPGDLANDFATDSRSAGGPPQQHDDAARAGVRHRDDAAAIDPSHVDLSQVDARALFADVIGDGNQTALLLDAAGLVLAGAYITADGSDVGQEIGAELSGVSDEARRAMRHLGLGEWSSIVFETEAASVALAPAPNDSLTVVAADRAIPLGFVRRLLDRASARARAWLGAQP